jgi:dihydroxy-acid dehydratase
MADNWRSKLITQGAARSPNRAMLRAVGFGNGDFDKAIVGVANGHSNMNPCNAGIQPLVDRAMAALRAAGAMPQMFGFPTVTDGIGMGTGDEIFARRAKSSPMPSRLRSTGK